MNLFTRRCGCGTVFALLHLRDRTQQCQACQRKAAARLHRQAVHTAALKVKYSKRLPPAAVHLCEGDFEQVGQCEMREPEQRIWYSTPGVGATWQAPQVLTPMHSEYGAVHALLAKLREEPPCP